MRAAGVLFLLALASAQAQPTENVIVNGKRVPDDEIRSFVQQRVQATHVLGKVARWEKPICPIATGLDAIHARFVIQRLREIATSVGAPVNASSSCATNIEIVFTNTPQTVLDEVRQRHKDYLGYFSSNGQADTLSKVTRPIQAWYATATIDVRGEPMLDANRPRGLPYCFDPPMCRIITSAPVVASRESHLGDGLRSGLFNVIVVVDRSRLGDRELGALTDYASLLALAQVRAPDTCDGLPTILNLLLPDCQGAAQEMTASDLGYLHGLYAMNAESNLRVQEDQIAFQLKQGLAGK
jgi:hypothetical protein